MPLLGGISSADTVPELTTGAGSPTSTPSAVGDVYVDTTNDQAWIAIGTSGAIDWRQATGVAEVGNLGVPDANDDSAGTGGNGRFFEGDIWIDTPGYWGAPYPDIYVCTDDTATAANWESLYTADVANLLFKPIEASGAGAPAAAPGALGTLYVDTTGENAYVGVDTVASSDYEQMLLFKHVLDEDTMATDSATRPPSQQSVKAYVDSGTVTMTNKTLTSPTVNTPQLNLTKSAGAAPTVEARVEYDTTLDVIVYGDGAATKRLATRSYVDQMRPTYRTNANTTDTLVLADAWKTVYYSNASQVTVTIPTNAVAYSVGTRINIVAGGAGGVTLTTTSLTLLPASANKTIAQGEAFFIEKAATNTWIIVGGTSA